LGAWIGLAEAVRAREAPAIACPSSSTSRAPAPDLRRAGALLRPGDQDVAHAGERVPAAASPGRGLCTLDLSLDGPPAAGAPPYGLGQRPVDILLDSTELKLRGPGEWDRRKHGEKRRAWRKLNLAVDCRTGEILPHDLTASDTADAAMAGLLVARASGRIRSVIADGAYDGAPVYAAIRTARPPRSPPKIVVPPSAPSIPTRGGAHGGTDRERHAAQITAHGRIP